MHACFTPVVSGNEIGSVIFGLGKLRFYHTDLIENLCNFSNKLESYFSLPIEYWDERYSSDVIFKEMRKSDFSATKIKKKLDQQSAAYILQGYLDRYRINV